MQKKTVLAVVAALIVAMPVFAQEHRPMSFTERYGQRLSLTDSQKTSIDEMEKKFDEEHATFLAGYHQTMADYRAARQANDTARIDILKPKMDSMRAEMMKLRATQEEKIAATFTDAQKETWNKIKEERAARMKEHEQHQH